MAVIQSLAATIGALSSPSCSCSQALRGVASGWRRFQRSTTSASRRSSEYEVADQISARTPNRSRRRSRAFSTSPMIAPEPKSRTRGPLDAASASANL